MQTFDPERPVRMCVCHYRTFLELKESGLPTVEAIAETYGCTTSCGSCRIYIERMLETGETSFPVLYPTG